jgi:hypothetical protein
MDSVRVDPAELLASLERVNGAIDSAGYPDAGYQLWVIQSDAADNYSFLINGFWPDKEAHDEIHNHELYQNAITGDEELWKNMKSTWYNRFTRTKWGYRHSTGQPRNCLSSRFDYYSV